MRHACSSQPSIMEVQKCITVFKRQITYIRQLLAQRQIFISLPMTSILALHASHHSTPHRAHITAHKRRLQASKPTRTDKILHQGQLWLTTLQHFSRATGCISDHATTPEKEDYTYDGSMQTLFIKHPCSITPRA